MAKGRFSLYNSAKSVNSPGGLKWECCCEFRLKYSMADTFTEHQDTDMGWVGS